MTDSSKPSQSTSRPPVDALQYEKLALAAFRLCDQQREKLYKLVTLAASVCRSPAVTNEERAQQRTLLQLLVDPGEAYQRSNECDSELFQTHRARRQGRRAQPHHGP
ncbi:hypothetical protein B0G69_5027 [Paraburkholderia sp. RAU2J]|nr:hypothetical protein B0G69_5027 [Paraburkholderia sp. RAU2J]